MSTLATSVGAVLFLFFAREGPYPFGRALFDLRQAGAVFRDRNLLLADLDVHSCHLGGSGPLFILCPRGALSLRTRSFRSAAGRGCFPRSKSPPRRSRCPLLPPRWERSSFYSLPARGLIPSDALFSICGRPGLFSAIEISSSPI